MKTYEYKKFITPDPDIDIFNKIGAEGWKFVSQDNFIYIFMREIGDGFENDLNNFMDEVNTNNNKLKET